MILIDSHCHLDRLNYKKIKKSLDEILYKSEKKYVKYILNVSTSIKNFEAMTKFIGNRKNIFYACGIHPFYYQKNIKTKEIIKKFKNKNVIAVGEIGLDYSNKNVVKKKKQKQMFLKQIKISEKLQKPIIVHTRNSIKDTIKILKKKKIKKNSGVIHSFNETNIKYIKKILDLNFYISISGIITFKNAEKLRKIIEYIPLEKLLIETDSPYLTPEPKRGKENEPCNLYYIAKKISEIKKIKLVKMSNIIRKNFQKLFKVKIK
ncbi:TatD family hydrolase [Buchnera aphidicola (Ceratoglyphina bambusae)]|uniref:TatD family hydrolase n=1 Tax=Buchnera aphidicola TaxID=9 RepID=UPI0031B88327